MGNDDEVDSNEMKPTKKKAKPIRKFSFYLFVLIG